MDHDRTRRRAVVHQQRRLDRPGHQRRGDQQLHPPTW
jgi:hypothetical protein